MTLHTTPTRLLLILAAYMLTLILLLTILLTWIEQQPEPAARPLRTRPPILEEPRT